MTSNIENFKSWYVQVLEMLYEHRDAGIAVLMISLPLLERYIRRKHNLALADNITDAAMGGLCAMFWLGVRVGRRPQGAAVSHPARTEGSQLSLS